MRKICTFDGCERYNYGYGLCRSHYGQRERGRPITALKPPSGSVPIEERFWQTVQMGEGCWEWTGGKNASGYGRAHVLGKRRLAHVVSYEMANGPLTEGLFVDHICRNTGCVRPDHLRPATKKQNAENRGPTKGKATPLGVSRYAKTGKYRARVMHFGVLYFLGQFDSAEEAGAVAAAKRNELFTHNDFDKEKP